MKTARKVLSVVLSVLLVISTVAIAASAYADVTYERASYALKAEVMDGSEGAAQEALTTNIENVYTSLKASQISLETADGRAYKSLTSHTYAAGGTQTNPIKVKAGQLVWVTVSVTTNFPAAIIEGYLFYSTNIFLCSAAKVANAVAANTSSAFYSVANKQWTTNTWANTLDAGRPKYTKAMGDNYHGDFFFGLIDADLVYGSDDGIIPTLTDDNLVSFPLYVNPNAEAGTVGTVVLNPDDGISYLASSPDEEDPEISDDEYAILRGSEYITGSTLYFQVEGTSASVDTAALEAAIAAYEALTSSAYTATSWANATAAYNDAKAALTSNDQATVDAAAAALTAALNALEEVVVLDYARIDAAIASVPANLSAYTTSTANAASAAKTAAQTARSTATTQAQLDNAAAALEAAVAALAPKANMATLNAALLEAANYSEANYTPESFGTLANRVSEGQALVNNADEVSDQAAVNTAAQNIYDAIAALVPLGADYSAVTAQINRYNALDKDLYTTASKKAVTDAIAEVVEGLPSTQQATVDAWAAAIKDAIDNLVKLANTSALAAAVAAANQADASDYTSADWTLLQGYVADAAQYLNNEATEAQQAGIDQLTANINGILANKLGDADYTAVEAAKARIPADLSIYTDATVTALNNAVAAVQYGLKDNEQSTVDGWATAINDAVDALQLKNADITALIQAISTGDAVNSALYTSESYAALATALSDAKALKDSNPTILQQNEVDAAAAAITDAIAALVPLGADFSALEAVIARADALNRDLYTADSLYEFDAALVPARNMLAAAEQYTVADQAAIDAMVVTANAAFAKLVLLPADYTAVQAAQDRAATYVAAYYPADLWANVQSALDAVEAGYTIDKQADVDAMAQAINDALDALEGKMLDADYTFVDRQIGRADALTETDYTAVSWAALEEALNAVVRGYTIDKQTDVDNMADAIVQAIRGLVQAGPADYTAVDAAIDEFEGLDTSIYTDESVAAVEAAIEAVERGLNENFQSQVDAMAQAINDALDNLVEKTYGPADYTAVDAAIAAFAAIEDKDLYTDESIATVNDAINAVVRGLDEREQATVDAMAKAINDAIEALELKPVIPPEPTGAIQSIEYTASASTAKTYTFRIEGRVNGVRFIQLDNNSTATIYRNREGLVKTSYNADGEVVSDLDVKNIAYEIWEIDLALKATDYVVIAQTGVGSKGWESRDLGYPVSVELTTADKAVISVTPDTTDAKVGEAVNVSVETGKDVIKVQFIVDDAEAGLKTFDLGGYGVAGEDSNTFNGFVKFYSAGEHTVKVRVRTAAGWEVSDYEAITFTATK